MGLKAGITNYSFARSLRGGKMDVEGFLDYCGKADFDGQLRRVVGMDADKQRLEGPQSVAEFRSDSLWQKHGDACSDPKKFHMRYGPEFLEKETKLVVAQQERVTATEEHIPYLVVTPDIVDLLLEVRMKIITGRVADESRTRAVTAVTGAPVRHQKQDAVRITMDQARDG